MSGPADATDLVTSPDEVPASPGTPPVTDAAPTTSPTAEWRRALATVRRHALPRRTDYAGLRQGWRADLLAGTTVAVVALPLALGFGVTSGVGAAAGLVTAVVAGLVTALLGGSNLQVSGPTGAMVVVLVPIVARHGAQAVPVVAIMAGGLVLLGGLVGLGRLISYVPWPVVEGFTMGIGVVIAAQQVPLALDAPKAPGENALLVGLRTAADADWAHAAPALAVVGGVIALMLLVPRLHRTLPVSLLAIVAATLVAEVTHLDVTRIGPLPSSLPVPSLPTLTPEATGALVSAAMAIAALAALESLLAARVADGLADDLPPTDPNRELVGQGLGTIAAGMFGGMPSTGALARTAVNVRAGARTRVAAVVHALVLALVVYAAGPLVARIPLAALAGVLLVTAARMVDLASARIIVRSGRSGASVWALTLATTLVFDLVVAVEVGVALAMVLALRAMARTSGLHRERLEVPELTSDAEQALLREHIAVYRIDGALFFADVRRFLDEFAQVADVRVVILRLSGVRVLDTSGAWALAQIVGDLRRRGIVVVLKGLRPEHRRLAAAVGVVDVPRGCATFATLPEAVEHARSRVHHPSEPR